MCSEDLCSSTLLEFSADPLSLASADVFIVTVPTPIDEKKRPDFAPLNEASKTVGLALKHRL